MSELPQERRLVTEIPGPRSRALQERKAAAVSSAVGTVMPVYVEAAGGGVVVDVDGNSLIDLGSGIAVTTVGNSNPRVVEAVSAQVQAFTHTCFMVTPYDGYVRVAEALNRLTPGSHDKRTALFNSGAEAVENAVKIARHHTKRQAVIAFDHAYHGRTNLTMALTAKNMPYKHGFGPFAAEVYRAPMSYPFRDAGVDGPAAARRAIEVIEKQVGAQNLAAVMIEPIQGEGGFVVPAPGFLPALVEWCAANGVVFVADEVQTGFARTGDLFACEHEDLVPDLIVTAKGIAGGLPLAAVTGRAEMMDAPHTGGLGGTYGGNPIACAAALAVIETIEADGLVDRARSIGKTMLDRLGAVQQRDSRIGDVRGRGAMVAVELVQPGTTEPDAALTGKVAAAAHQQGLVVLTCGTYGNVLRFLPPLSIPDHLLDEAFGVLDAIFAEPDLDTRSLVPRSRYSITEGVAVELEHTEGQVGQPVQARHRVRGRPCGDDVDLLDQVAAHVPAAVAREDPAVRVEHDETAARGAQGRQHPLLCGLDAYVGTGDADEAVAEHQRRRERQRVVLGAEVVDVRAGDVAVPGVARHDVPRQVLVVVEAAAVRIRLDHQPLHVAVVAREPLQPPGHVLEQSDSGHEAGALDQLIGPLDEVDGEVVDPREARTSGWLGQLELAQSGSGDRLDDVERAPGEVAERVEGRGDVGGDVGNRG